MRTRLAVCLVVGLAAVAATAQDDVYLAGFAAAIVQRDFGLEVERVEVNNRVARIVIEDLQEHHAESIADAVARIEDIDRVYVFREGDESDTLASAYSDNDDDDEDRGLEF